MPNEMVTEEITERISIQWNSFDANVLLDNKVIKRFKNHELSYQNARRFAMDKMFELMKESW